MNSSGGGRGGGDVRVAGLALPREDLVVRRLLACLGRAAGGSGASAGAGAAHTAVSAVVGSRGDALRHNVAAFFREIREPPRGCFRRGEPRVGVDGLLGGQAGRVVLALEEPRVGVAAVAVAAAAAAKGFGRGRRVVVGVVERGGVHVGWGGGTVARVAGAGLAVGGRAAGGRDRGGGGRAAVVGGRAVGLAARWAVERPRVACRRDRRGGQVGRLRSGLGNGASVGASVGFAWVGSMHLSGKEARGSCTGAGFTGGNGARPEFGQEPAAISRVRRLATL